MPSPLRRSTGSLKAFRNNAELTSNLKDQDEISLKHQDQHCEPENQEENPRQNSKDTCKGTNDNSDNIQDDDECIAVPSKGNVQPAKSLSETVLIRSSPTRRQRHETFARMPSAPVHGSNALLVGSSICSSSSPIGNRHTRRRATEPEQVLRDLPPRLRASSNAFSVTSPPAALMLAEDFELFLRSVQPLSNYTTSLHLSPSKAPYLSTINDLNLSIRNNLIETLYQIEPSEDKCEDDSDEVDREDTTESSQNFGIPVDKIVHTQGQLHSRVSEDQLQRSSHVSASQKLSSASSSNDSTKSSTSSKLFAMNMTLADAIRLSYAHNLGKFPSKCLREGRLCVEGRSKEYMVTLTEAGLSWWVPNSFFKSFKQRSLQLDTIVGATNDFTGVFTVHFYIKATSSSKIKLPLGKSNDGGGFVLPSPKKLSKKKESRRPTRREHGSISFRSVYSEDAVAWVEAIQLAVKWSARVPFKSTRNLLVVLNEPLDSYKSDNLWRQHKISLDIGRFNYEVIQTQTMEEMRALGRHFGGSTTAGNVSCSSSSSLNTSSKKSKYECILFIGPDRMVNCFYEGVLQQPQDDWKYLLATLPMAFLPITKRRHTGDEQGLFLSVDTVLYCILKRKYKKINTITYQTDAYPHVCVAFADIACGIASSNRASNTEATSPKSPCRSSFSGFVPSSSQYMYRSGTERSKSSSQVTINKLKQTYFFSNDKIADFKYVPASNSSSSISITKDPRGRKEQYHIDKLEEEEEEEEAQELHHIEFCSVYNRQVPHELKRWNGECMSVLDPGSDQVFDKEWKEPEKGCFFSMQVTSIKQQNHQPLFKLVVHRKQHPMSQLFSGKGRQPSWLRDEAKAVMIQHTNPTALRVDGHNLPLHIQEIRAQMTKNLIVLASE
jgi:hypothetical protein